MKKLNKLSYLFAGMMSVAAVTVTPAYAEDKALIIGIGEYKNPSNNLKGIEYDVSKATDIAGRLGITNITTLTDSQATMSAVKSALEDLADSTGSNDKVLVYFSGHGGQVKDKTGDEDDGYDETIVVYDGHIVDDNLNDLLSNIGSDNMVVLLDACHSGTGTRSLAPNRMSSKVQTAQIKSIPFEASLTDKDFYVNPVTSENHSQHYVSIGAAQDNQKSLATPNGSIFTNSLFESFEETRASSGSTTWQNLYNSAKYKIDALPLKSKAFTPKIEGEGVNKQIIISEPSNSLKKLNWKTMVDTISKLDNNINIQAPTQLNVGDKLEFQVTIPSDGYLHVLSVGANDDTVVLFPNEFVEDNQVRKNQTLTLPGNGKFTIDAQEPRGDAMIAVFVTPNQVDLRDKGYGHLTSKGTGNGHVFAKGSANTFLTAILADDIRHKDFGISGVSSSDKKGNYVVINVK